MSENAKLSREQIIANMKANATFKKAAKLCEKYGYELDTLLIHKENSWSGISFRVLPTAEHMIGRLEISTISLHRDLERDWEAEDAISQYQFEAGTASFGSMKAEQYAHFAKSVERTGKLVTALSKLDLHTLYTVETVKE